MDVRRRPSPRDPAGLTAGLWMLPVCGVLPTGGGIAIRAL